MPNWCSNILEIQDTCLAIEEKIAKMGDKGLFQTLVTTNRAAYYKDDKIQHLMDVIEEDKYFDWYNHNCNEYGTKWDVHEFHYNDGVFTFETAWAPPIEFVQKLSKQYQINCRLEYSEPGWDVAGITYFENGEIIEEESYSYWEYVLKYNPEELYLELDNEFEEEEDKIEVITKYGFDKEDAERILKQYYDYQGQSNEQHY